MNGPCMSSAEYILEQLDTAQREAATALRGPVAILAGAGTGKTRTITHRIAYGVQQGVFRPENLLSLSFTRKAAGEMHTRLHALGVHGVRAQTFHSAALAQLKHFWPKVYGGDTPRIIQSKVELLVQIAERDMLKTDPETLGRIASEIEWRKISLATLETYERLCARRDIAHEVDPELILSYMSRYEHLKNSRNLIDLEDLLVNTVAIIENEREAAEEVHDRFKYFTVDEYQDVSPLQYRLLRAWLGARRELCVVGDASQTIYSFAGASSRYLLNFKRDFPEAQIVRLETSYRSNSEIITLANRLIQNKPGALSLTAHAGKTGHKPVLVAFGNEREEAEAVAHEIARCVQQGAKPEEIAVLTRTNAQHPIIMRALAAQGLFSRSEDDTDFFATAEVRELIASIIGEANEGPGRDAAKVVQKILDKIASQEKESGSMEARKTQMMRESILDLAKKHENISLGSFVGLLKKNMREKIVPKMPVVTLSSVHSAKGLEWPIVFLTGLSEGIFPIYRAQTDEEIEEERRLMYVAITRAQRELYFSGYNNPDAGKTLSRFLKEINLKPRRS